MILYIRYPLSLRQVEDLLFERGIDICYETVRLWWNRFGPMFAAATQKRRIHHRSYAVFATKRWHREAALRFLKRAMKRYGRLATLVTDRQQSYWAAMKVIGNGGRQETRR